jgi:hypothetical protein
MPRILSVVPDILKGAGLDGAGEVSYLDTEPSNPAGAQCTHVARGQSGRRSSARSIHARLSRHLCKCHSGDLAYVRVAHSSVASLTIGFMDGPRAVRTGQPVTWSIQRPPSFCRGCLRRQLCYEIPPHVPVRSRFVLNHMPEEDQLHLAPAFPGRSVSVQSNHSRSVVASRTCRRK